MKLIMVANNQNTFSRLPEELVLVGNNYHVKIIFRCRSLCDYKTLMSVFSLEGK